ncbi:MAG TPA: hypothetical protein VIE89_32200 [Candidatus Binatia bacterium]|jgi:hypothetical protein
MTAPASMIAIHDSGKLFEPDTILPTQFYAMFKSNQYRDPERRLMVAILEDAVSCLSADLRQCNPRQKKQYEEAKHWVTTNEESEWIFSFRNICEVLGLDPDYLRRGLIRSRIGSPTRGQVTLTTRRPARNLRSVLPPRKIRIRTTS